MTNTTQQPKPLISAIIDKNNIKQKVYQSAQDCFNLMKQSCDQFVKLNKPRVKSGKYPLLFEFSNRGVFECQLKFGSDVLIFFMHSNVFEIPRNHFIMKSSYITEDKSRSYCGIIYIYNFLADSLKYARTQDLGYCIGRIFINHEKHFYIEGKQEISLLYNNFATNIFEEKEVSDIIQAAIRYSLNFDLLIPPFDEMKQLTVQEIQSTLDTISVKTGKRLGFQFQADNIE